MRKIKIGKFTYTKIALFLLAINIIGGYIWLFGFHTARLLMLSMTGFTLLIMFFLQRNTTSSIHLKIVLIFLLSLGIIRNFSLELLPDFLLDLSSLGIIFSILLIRKINYNQLIKSIIFIGVVSLLYFAYTLPNMDLSLITAQINRSEAFTSYGSEVLQGGASKGYVIYATQQLAIGFLLFFLLLIPFLNKVIHRKYLLLLIITLILFIFIFSGFYQKRQPIAELTIILILAFVFYRKLLIGVIPKNIFLSLFFGLILLYFMLTSNILTNVFERFDNTLSDISNFDRIEESIQVFSSFYLTDWIFGKGIGYIAPDTPGGIILHIGYSNLIMKGGLILLLLYLGEVVKNIMVCYKKAKTYPLFYVGVVFSFFSLIQLFYAPGYSWHATSLITGLAMFSRYPLKSIIYDKYSNSRA